MSQIGNLALDAEALYQELVRGVRQLIAQSGVAHQLVGVTSGGAGGSIARISSRIGRGERKCRPRYRVSLPFESPVT